MLRRMANEVPRLVRRLGSGKRSSVDAARARLSIMGARAVENLIAALDDGNNRTRARVMPLLALIQDPRGREPLIAMLLDRNPRLRAVAARSLARYPAPSTVAALNRLLDRERTGRVRIAAVQALVELYSAGQEDAVCRVLELLTDPEQPARLRLSGFALLPMLGSPERRTLLARLKQDPAGEVRSRAEAGTKMRQGGERSATATKRLLADLGSDDYAVWNRAVRQLAAWGSFTVTPLLEAMQHRSHDPEYCTRAGMALKAMGPRRGRVIAEALDNIDEPVPLQALVETIGALGVKSLIYRLTDLLDRIEGRRAEGGATDSMQGVLAKAHLELARIGSRVAIDSLRQALADAARPIELELLTAVEIIGKREEIGVLLAAYAREDEFARERIAVVVRSIVKREKIRRTNRIFRTMNSRQRAAFEAVLPRRKPPGRTLQSMSPPRRLRGERRSGMLYSGRLTPLG